MSTAWNHNTHYHPIVLRSVPSPCRRALDVGCGEGCLTLELAGRCDAVTAIDSDPDTLASASANAPPNVTFFQGDIMTYPLPQAGFDFVAVVATLHHLPLRPALERLSNLLSSDGVIAVIGLYRMDTIADLAAAALAVPINWMLRCIRPYRKVEAPTAPPRETLREIRAAAASLMPGCVVTRHLFFRYSLIGRKPSGR
jgi:trans-aconitate methyltransferase